MLKTPVVYIFFNRPEVTARTFEAVRRQRPCRLYLVADGPRANHPTDAQRCEATRRIVEQMLDWPCDVTRDYSPVNLGCGKRVASGLTAAFAKLGEAIIIEDDILPHPDFFRYCSEMLAKYRDDPRIHAISGFNAIGRYSASGYTVPTIFFSMWGWASWQRAWRDYSFEMAGWQDPDVKRQISEHIDNPLIYQWHANDFDSIARDHVDTWDFQWRYTMMKHRRHAVMSSVNFIENLGFNADATHTTFQEPYARKLGVFGSPRNRRVPESVGPDRLHDRIYSEIVMTGSDRKISLLRLLSRSRLLVSLLERRYS